MVVLHHRIFSAVSRLGILPKHEYYRSPVLNGGNKEVSSG